MTDPLEPFWVCLETDAPRLTVADLGHWPPGVVQQLITLKLLERTDNSTQVVCPNCDRGHVEEVMPRRGRDGTVRFFIRCPEALKVEVPETLLYQWTIGFESIVQGLAEALTLKGRPAVVVPDRLWRLGKTTWQGTSREILLVRGLAWPDAHDVTHRISSNGRPIALVADRVPLTNVWPGKPPAVVALSQVATPGGPGIELDVTHLMLLVHDADAALEAAQMLPLDRRQKKLLVRNQLKAELKSFLKDDDLAAAYEQHGSYRKAAAALSAERGTSISKDMVRRAVQRRGGTKAVALAEDSQSVRRTVASHRRDRTRKIMNHP